MWGTPSTAPASATGSRQPSPSAAVRTRAPPHPPARRGSTSATSIGPRRACLASGAACGCAPMCGRRRGSTRWWRGGGACAGSAASVPPGGWRRRGMLAGCAGRRGAASACGCVRFGGRGGGRSWRSWRVSVDPVRVLVQVDCVRWVCSIVCIVPSFFYLSLRREDLKTPLFTNLTQHMPTPFSKVHEVTVAQKHHVLRRRQSKSPQISSPAVHIRHPLARPRPLSPKIREKRVQARRVPLDFGFNAPSRGGTSSLDQLSLLPAIKKVRLEGCQVWKTPACAQVDRRTLMDVSTRPQQQRPRTPAFDTTGVVKALGLKTTISVS